MGSRERPESEASPSDDRSPFQLIFFNDLNKSYVWMRAAQATGYFNDCWRACIQREKIPLSFSHFKAE